MPENGQWQRLAVHVPRHELTTEEPNEALYKLFGDCRKGIFVAKIGSRSFLRRAEPAVQERVFLTAVNGRELDRFGYGINTDYAADRIAFSDLIFMVPDLDADVEFETCAHGRVTKHKASLQWLSEYDSGLRYVDEPTLDGVGQAYEFFGDICVVQMTMNHIGAVVASTGDPGPTRWTHPSLVSQPRLMVSYVQSGSYVSDVLVPGAALAKVNGHEVRTLDEFRQHFEPALGGGNATGIWTLETDLGRLVAVTFNQTLHEQVSKAKAMQAAYLLTPSVVKAAKTSGLLSHGSDPTVFEQNGIARVASGKGDDSVARIYPAGPLATQRQLSGRGVGARSSVVTKWDVSVSRGIPAI
jgi:hypothetical protein